MPAATLKINRIAFGATAAVVTSMALITGLGAADAAKRTVVSALLIAALADNLTDSLSVHIYQEAERLEKHEAFVGTVTNFAARLVLCLSFVFLVAMFSLSAATVIALIWGICLLATLTWILARERKIAPGVEMLKHVIVALVVIAASRGIGQWIGTHFA